MTRSTVNRRQAVALSGAAMTAAALPTTGLADVPSARTQGGIHHLIRALEVAAEFTPEELRTAIEEYERGTA